MQLDLDRQLRGIVGMIPLVLLQRRRLPQLLAEQELAVDQLDGGLRVVPQRREFAEVLGRRHALADRPALALVDPQHRRQPRRRQVAEAGQERRDDGPLAPPPAEPQVLRRIALRGCSHPSPRPSRPILGGDAVEGAGKLLAPGLRRAAQHGGDLGPRPPLGADRRLVAANQLGRCLLVAGANPQQELREGAIVGHGPVRGLASAAPATFVPP